MVFYTECTEEEFEAFQEKQKKDDKRLKRYLQGLNHKQLNFTILNLGNVLQICAIYFELKQDNIDSYLKLEKDKLKKARMETIVKELNQSINLRFEFEEDTEVVEGLFIYEGQNYMLLNKMKFLVNLRLGDKYPNF